MIKFYYFEPNFSLLKPDKYATRRSHKGNQAISTIMTEHDSNSGLPGIGQGVYRGKPPGIIAGAMQHSPHTLAHNYYDREIRHTQVKTYTDQGNGFNQRSGSTTLYSKVGLFDILILKIIRN